MNEHALLSMLSSIVDAPRENEETTIAKRVKAPVHRATGKKRRAIKGTS